MMTMMLSAAMVAGVPMEKDGPVEENMMIVDDFSRKDGLSSLNTRWRYIADRVMGGVSRGAMRMDTLADRLCLRLQGEVSLENSGGFIQVALPLSATSAPFDGRPFTGLRLSARGNGGTYYVHLRTSDSRRPWQYYYASFVAADEWRDIDLPFAMFTSKGLDMPLDTSRLVRVAIVAARKAHVADIAVSWIGFFTERSERSTAP